MHTNVVLQYYYACTMQILLLGCIAVIIFEQPECYKLNLLVCVLLT